MRRASRSRRPSRPTPTSSSSPATAAQSSARASTDTVAASPGRSPRSPRAKAARCGCAASGDGCLEPAGTTVERGLAGRLAGGLRVAVDLRSARGRCARRSSCERASTLRAAAGAHRARRGCTRPRTASTSSEVNGGRWSATTGSRPGWTSYSHRLRYQTHDLTAPLRDGRERARRVARGRLVPRPHRLRRRAVGHLRHGCRAARAARAHDVDGDACRRPARLDLSHESPITAVGLYEGETYDARLLPDGWSAPGFDGVGLGAGDRLARERRSPAAIEAPTALPVRETEALASGLDRPSPSGRIRLDFGQNISGVLRIRPARAARAHHRAAPRRGASRTASSASAPSGRRPPSTRTSPPASSGEEWSPRFTIHGFQYAELEDWPGELRDGDVEAVVIHTDMRRTGWFESSHAGLNQLHSNVVWSMRDNFVDLPTDCPQRDERVGLDGRHPGVRADGAAAVRGARHAHRLAARPRRRAGRAGARAPTSCRGSTAGSRTSRRPRGGMPRSSCRGRCTSTTATRGSSRTSTTACARGSTSWTASPGTPACGTPASSSGTGSIRPRRRRAPATRTPTSTWSRRRTTSRPRASWPRPRRCSATASGAERYRRIAERATRAFQDEFISASGRVVSDTATSIARRPGVRPVRLCRSRRHARASGCATSSATAGSTSRPASSARRSSATPSCCAGSMDYAYHLLLQEGLPSWLYPVTMGATTIWERWDSMLPDGVDQPRRHDLVQPLRPRRGRRLHASRRRGAVIGRARLGASSGSRPAPEAGSTHASAQFDSVRGTAAIVVAAGGRDADDRGDGAGGIPRHRRPARDGEEIAVGPGRHSFRTSFRAVADDPDAPFFGWRREPVEA